MIIFGPSGWYYQVHNLALISYSPNWSSFIVYISTQTTKVPIWSWSPSIWHLDFNLASIRKMALKRFGKDLH
ncbi:hypothetical protein SLA2020_491100 [Shorea laevis]